MPIGTKEAVLLPDDDFGAVARVLKGVDLEACDFEVSIERAGRGDLVFADPPYTVLHGNNGFVRYNDRLFSWPDQIRLEASLRRAAERGAIVACTNAAHESIEKLYGGHFHVKRLQRQSLIAGDTAFRRQAEELFISSYKTE